MAHDTLSHKIRGLSTTIAVATMVSGTISMGFLGFSAKLTGELVDREMVAMNDQEWQKEPYEYDAMAKQKYSAAGMYEKEMKPMMKDGMMKEGMMKDGMKPPMMKDGMMMKEGMKPPMMQGGMVQMPMKPADMIAMAIKKIEASGIDSEDALYLKKKLQEASDRLGKKDELTDEEKKELKLLLEKTKSLFGDGAMAKKNPDAELLLKHEEFKQKMRQAMQSGDQAALEEVLNAYAKWREEMKQERMKMQMQQPEGFMPEMMEPMHEDEDGMMPMEHGYGEDGMMPPPPAQEGGWEMTAEEASLMAEDAQALLDEIQSQGISLNAVTIEVSQLAMGSAKVATELCTYEESLSCELALLSVNGHMMTLQDLLATEAEWNADLDDVIGAFFGESEEMELFDEKGMNMEEMPY